MEDGAEVLVAREASRWTSSGVQTLVIVDPEGNISDDDDDGSDSTEGGAMLL